MLGLRADVRKCPSWQSSVTPLDGSIQKSSKIVNPFVRLRQEFRLSYRFIGHGLVVVEPTDARSAVHQSFVGEFAAAGPRRAMAERPAG
jgi:ABC-type microcin C transport system duplicated ATPase subunit YejF